MRVTYTNKYLKAFNAKLWGKKIEKLYARPVVFIPGFLLHPDQAKEIATDLEKQEATEQMLRGQSFGL